jgi:hypothetical protein
MQLMKLTAQPKKLFINLASTTISTLIRNLSLQTRLFERFFECLAEKNACVREKSVEFTKEMIEMCVKDDSMRNQLSRSQSTLDAVERLIHKALSDASQLARENAKDLFFLFQENWPDRAAVYEQVFTLSYIINDL